MIRFPRSNLGREAGSASLTGHILLCFPKLHPYKHLYSSDSRLRQKNLDFLEHFSEPIVTVCLFKHQSLIRDALTVKRTNTSTNINGNTDTGTDTDIDVLKSIWKPADNSICISFCCYLVPGLVQENKYSILFHLCQGFFFQLLLTFRQDISICQFICRNAGINQPRPLYQCTPKTDYIAYWRT